MTSLQIYIDPEKRSQNRGDHCWNEGLQQIDRMVLFLRRSQQVEPRRTVYSQSGIFEEVLWRAITTGNQQRSS